MNVTHPTITRLDHGKALAAAAAVFILALAESSAQNTDPVVTNVLSGQRPGTKLVDIVYDVSDAEEDELQITVEISNDNGLSFVVPASALSEGATSNSYPTVTFPGGMTSLTGRTIVWDAGVDFNHQFNSGMVVRVVAKDESVPSGMALVDPAGVFRMGDSTGASAGNLISEEPDHDVSVSAFYIDVNEVTEELWDSVHDWALLNGYTLGGLPDRAMGIGPKHPAKNISWYQAVIWCNARSEKEGLTPVYYTNAMQTTVYRTGLIDLEETFANWAADGYRLPTEAEWEKAARGGLAGLNYPWGGLLGQPENADINHGNANYKLVGGFFSDTSPAGFYTLNGYGLADMSGNLWEWCWDAFSNTWYFQPGATAPDTRGPSPFTGTRVLRGGSWFSGEDSLRCSARNMDAPNQQSPIFGFRTVRGL